MSEFFDQIGGGGFSTQPVNPKFKPPQLKKLKDDEMMPKLPEADRLFAIQNNLLRSLNSDTEEGTEHFARQAYKALVSYLKEHG